MTEAANSDLGEDVGDDPSPRGKTCRKCYGACHIFSVLWVCCSRWMLPSEWFPLIVGEYDMCESCRTGSQCGALFASPFIFFSPRCLCSRGGVLLCCMGKSEEDLNKQLQQTPSRPPPQPALMARWDLQKHSKFNSILMMKSAGNWSQHSIIMILFT